MQCGLVEIWGPSAGGLRNEASILKKKLINMEFSLTGTYLTRITKVLSNDYAHFGRSDIRSSAVTLFTRKDYCLRFSANPLQERPQGCKRSVWFWVIRRWLEKFNGIFRDSERNECWT